MKIKILFTGDCRLDGKHGGGIRELFTLFPDYDLYVLNLETSIQMDSGVELAQKSVPIAASLEEAEFLIRQIDPEKLLLNFANNHALDSGQKSYDLAVQWFQEKGSTVIRDGESKLLRIGDYTIQFHALDLLSEASLPVVNISDASLSVALIHWGEEYVFAPSPYQQKAALTLMKKGMDLIVGSHSHVIQGWKTTGRKSVYYSLGNTVFEVPGVSGISEIGSVMSFQLLDGACKSEIIPLRILNSGSIRLLDEDEGCMFEDLTSLFRSQTDVSSLEWCALASRAFFKNHMSSWIQRISRYGFIELLRMARAFCRRMYLRMLMGLLLSVFLGKRQRDLEDRLLKLVR